ncbi:FAD:protein FMN transferase [Variovorax paradoxus]|uniref:FAD:protein FMN transferase n=1 Tax=Variovorax paradoxus TaxID=34073 RepID=A0A0H2LTN1_VARPD|nr:FAD:protein FMN transferase [Variovorax paradoxus]KLN53549.1 thiamine biosynthesis lipoprotein ApbE precursor [Variovorax paradoxus]
MSRTSIEWLRGARLKDCRTSGATMGTRYTARFVVPEETDVQAIVAGLEAAVTAVDAQMSNWKADSDLSRLNRAAPDGWVPVSVNLASVLVRAAEVGRETGNAFNIGVGALVDAWGFGPAGQDCPRVMSTGFRACRPLDELLEVDLPGRRVRKHACVALDLCGIAKGFGVDELARVLDRHGIGSWLVGIDGEMRSRGCKPDGSPWAIALEAPEDDRRTAMGVIELGDAAIATSGDYRHWSVIDGERVSHTMDPRTGAPLRGAVTSVTVIAPTCTDADAYATALMVLGVEAGRDHARRQGLDALFVTREGNGLRTVGTGFFDGA